jgi:hypothetical protein
MFVRAPETKNPALVPLVVPSLWVDAPIPVQRRDKLIAMVRAAGGEIGIAGEFESYLF